MKRKEYIIIKPLLCILSVIPILLSTGCWDRVEVNDIALIMASAFDTAPDGKLLGTSQVMLPSGGGLGAGEAGAGSESKKSFIVESAVGIDPGEAQSQIQMGFSRRLFRGHRRVIVIGEELAKLGIGEVLDSISRDPQNRLRTHMLVAKGSRGSDILRMKYPMERVPAEAMREMINIGVGVEVTIRDFLIASSSEGIQPIATVIEADKGTEGFKLAGIAVFKDLKLVGYLDGESTNGYLWLAGRLHNGLVTTEIPGIEGEISIDVITSDVKIKPYINGDKIKFEVLLSGEGAIHGNGTKLDFTNPKNTKLAEEAAEEEIKKQVLTTIKIIKDEFKADIVGFGSVINRENPKEWKKLKNKWDEVFPNTEIEVTVDFAAKQTGMSGPPLYLRENEVIKE
ncbi:spore germination protein B3 precursor [Oxobacter pfennigii]|uniref:Spore germination protein B3 n=1 Tax=Oxobacter pfennigii TaxID=36849 RepID=A0A0N8NTD8_9CLOT|nr:Ger(x)C family spore germination protein [Oxobacter pfennigii]KPU44552.1 spore germination protein B3 precursor [Oxobacter pfennigii]